MNANSLLSSLNPSFVRFYTAESDSESNVVRRRSRREEIPPEGVPGSRRHRRFMNSILSDYESEMSLTEAETEDEAAESAPVVKFEWNSVFTRVGEDFFTKQGTVASEVPRKRKERMSREERALMMERAYRRRQARALAQSQNQNQDQGQSQSQGAEVLDEKSEMEALEQRLEAVRVAELHQDEAELTCDEDFQGSAASHWMRLDRRARTSFKRLPPNSYFIRQLEGLLVPYKKNELTFEHVHGFQSEIFSVVSRAKEFPKASLDVYDDDDEEEEEEEEEVLESKRSRVSDSDSDEQETRSQQRQNRKQGKGKSKSKSKSHKHKHQHKKQKEQLAPLRLLLNDAYSRFLAHGVAQYHQLVSFSQTDSEGNRVTFIQRPKKIKPTFFSEYDNLQTHLAFMHERRVRHQEGLEGTRTLLREAEAALQVQARLWRQKERHLHREKERERQRRAQQSGEELSGSAQHKRPRTRAPAPAEQDRHDHDRLEFANLRRLSKQLEENMRLNG